VFSFNNDISELAHGSGPHNKFLTSDFSINQNFNFVVNDDNNGYGYSTLPFTMVNFSRTENNGDGNFHLEFVNRTQFSGDHGDYGVGFGFYDTGQGGDSTGRSPFIISAHITDPFSKTNENIPAIQISMDGTNSVTIGSNKTASSILFATTDANSQGGLYSFVTTDHAGLGSGIGAPSGETGSLSLSPYAMSVFARTENTPYFHTEFVNQAPGGGFYGVGFGFSTNFNSGQQPFYIWPQVVNSFDDTNASGGTQDQPALTILTDGSGFVGIGGNGLLQIPQYTLDVFGDINMNGSLYQYGEVKAFIIDHPVLKNAKLVHSCIEGPRVDLIYRGIVKLVKGSGTVNIDTDSSTHPMTQGTFVALCANPQFFLQNNDSFDRVRGKIEGNILSIFCENLESTDTIGWMVVAERKDPAIKKDPKTDSSGFLIPEHSK
jgi:hypothetical protein